MVSGRRSGYCASLNSANGNIHAYYATGNVENTGYIQYETEEIGGMLSHWYLLYTDDGAFYLGFRDDGSAYKLELFVGNGADPRYVRLDGTGGIADDGRGIDEILASEAYLGIWAAAVRHCKLQKWETAHIRGVSLGQKALLFTMNGFIR